MPKMRSCGARAKRTVDKWYAIMLTPLSSFPYPKHFTLCTFYFDSLRVHKGVFESINRAVCKVLTLHTFLPIFGVRPSLSYFSSLDPAKRSSRIL